MVSEVSTFKVNSKLNKLNSFFNAKNDPRSFFSYLKTYLQLREDLQSYLKVKKNLDQPNPGTPKTFVNCYSAKKFEQLFLILFRFFELNGNSSSLEMVYQLAWVDPKNLNYQDLKSFLEIHKAYNKRIYRIHTKSTPNNKLSPDLNLDGAYKTFLSSSFLQSYFECYKLDQINKFTQYNHLIVKKFIWIVLMYTHAFIKESNKYMLFNQQELKSLLGIEVYTFLKKNSLKIQEKLGFLKLDLKGLSLEEKSSTIQEKTDWAPLELKKVLLLIQDRINFEPGFKLYKPNDNLAKILQSPNTRAILKSFFKFASAFITLFFNIKNTKLLGQIQTEIYKYSKILARVSNLESSFLISKSFFNSHKNVFKNLKTKILKSDICIEKDKNGEAVLAHLVKIPLNLGKFKIKSFNTQGIDIDNGFFEKNLILQLYKKLRPLKTKANLPYVSNILNLRRNLAVKAGFDSYLDYRLNNRIFIDKSLPLDTLFYVFEQIVNSVTSRSVNKGNKGLKSVSEVELLNLKDPVDLLFMFSKLNNLEQKVLFKKSKELISVPQFKPPFLCFNKNSSEKSTLKKELKNGFYVDYLKLIKGLRKANLALKVVSFKIKQLYGLQLKFSEKIVYSKDVQILKYSVFYKKKQIGYIFMDLYRRSDKYSGAFMDVLINRTKNQVPVIFLSLNLKRNDIGRDGLQTLYHELGHALHQLMDFTEIPYINGTTGAGYFVEFPSQFLQSFTEEYTYEAFRLLQKITRNFVGLDKDHVNYKHQLNDFWAQFISYTDPVEAKYSINTILAIIFKKLQKEGPDLYNTCNFSLYRGLIYAILDLYIHSSEFFQKTKTSIGPTFNKNYDVKKLIPVLQEFWGKKITPLLKKLIRGGHLSKSELVKLEAIKVSSCSQVLTAFAHIFSSPIEDYSCSYYTYFYTMVYVTLVKHKYFKSSKEQKKELTNQIKCRLLQKGAVNYHKIICEILKLNPDKVLPEFISCIYSNSNVFKDHFIACFK